MYYLSNIIFAYFQIRSSGFGLDTLIVDNIILAFNDLFVQIHFNDINVIGKLLADKVNKYWYGRADVYNTFHSWCAAQNETSLDGF